MVISFVTLYPSSHAATGTQPRLSACCRTVGNPDIIFEPRLIPAHPGLAIINGGTNLKWRLICL
jgi:hypothetical protein